MSYQINRAERIYDWAQQVQAVEFVNLINKRFGGMFLYDKRDAAAVIKACDLLLEDITKIQNVSETGLGVPLITIKKDGKNEG